MTPRRLAILLAFLTFGSVSAARAADPPKPVKVFILAGQSNMEGQAVADLDGKDYNDGKGTLKALLDDPAKAPLVKHLRTEKGAWTVRDDVWVRYQREKQPLLAGPLTIGFARLRREAPLRAGVAVRPRRRRPLRPNRCCSSRPRGAARACTRTSARRVPAARSARTTRR